VSEKKGLPSRLLNAENKYVRDTKTKMDNNKTKPRRGGEPEANVPPPLEIVVLQTNPTEKKTLTKRYLDGRVLTLLVEDNRLLEKSLTFYVRWDYRRIEEEKKEGRSISFMYWEKGGLEVALTFFGSYLVRKMYTLDFTRQTVPNLVLDDWKDELTYDIAFPMVDLKKITLKQGFSSDEIDNPFMKNLMHDMVMHSLSKNQKKEMVVTSIEKDSGNDCLCDLCGENPCVWVTERETVIANDEIEHGHILAMVNKTRRKIAFRHMFRVINGGPGQKGVRKRLPVCVENGIRAVFPDEEYMGFRED
jgi:hypothetical protein